MKILALVALLLASVFAVFEDDAFHTDWHHGLVGQPFEETTIFHQPFSNSRASLIYTLSDHAVLAAINPKDGGLVWRHRLSAAVNSSIAILRAAEGQDAVYAAVNNHVSAWSASDGRFGWLHAQESGHVKDVETLDSGDLQDGKIVDDVVVLAEGSQPSVKRLNGVTGEHMWTYVDTSGDTPLKLSIGTNQIRYVSLHKSILSGYKIRVTAIDPSNGRQTHQLLLSSDNEVTAPEHVLFVGANSAVPVIVWTDKTFSVLKMNVIGTNGLSVFAVDRSRDIESITVRAPRTGSSPHFVVAYRAKDSHWAETFHVQAEREQVFKSYSLQSNDGISAFSASVSGGDVYFTRVAKDGIAVYASTSETAVERYTPDGFGLPGMQDLPEPLHVISEVMPRHGQRPAVRVAILLSSGDWVLNLNGALTWYRLESLVDAVSATFVDLPQRESLAQQLAIEGHSNIFSAYIRRLKRHLKDLEQLPDILKALPDQVLAPFTGKEVTTTRQDLKADSFGFHKLALVATKNGRLVALDTLNGGKLVWNIKLPDYDPNVGTPSVAATPQGEIRVKIRDESYSYETATGKFVRKDVAATLGAETRGTVVQYEVSDGELVGYLPDKKSSPVWKYTPTPGESIVALSTRPEDDSVASIGKVLGDRSVLYKYLNPNILLVTTADPSTKTVSMHLLDSVSGKLLYEASHPEVDTSRPVATVMSENWFCYSFASAPEAGSLSRGYQLVSAELFESSIPNDRGPLGVMSNFSSTAIGSDPYVVAQSYQVPEEISLMTVSRTRQGITSRLLLAVVPESNSIVGIPRQAIDPRRTVSRDPSSQEQTEGLSKYSPILDFDPRWSLNHKREVFGTKNIVTSPAVLESTSLVLAYGFDVFGTRVSPSFTFDILGKDFNKIQMLLTVAALFVGVVVLAPLANRKQINLPWQLGVS